MYTLQDLGVAADLKRDLPPGLLVALASSKDVHADCRTAKANGFGHGGALN